MDNEHPVHVYIADLQQVKVYGRPLDNSVPKSSAVPAVPAVRRMVILVVGATSKRNSWLGFSSRVRIVEESIESVMSRPGRAMAVVGAGTRLAVVY